MVSSKPPTVWRSDKRITSPISITLHTFLVSKGVPGWGRTKRGQYKSYCAGIVLCVVVVLQTFNPLECGTHNCCAGWY